MPESTEFEIRRQENIKSNGALLETLGVNEEAKVINDPKTNEPPTKKRKVEKARLNLPPSRSSARIASAPSQPTYDEDVLANAITAKQTGSKPNKRRPSASSEEYTSTEPSLSPSPQDREAFQPSWTSWTPTAPPPTRDESGFFHFPSHPTFTPNKSPEEMLREGSFGGSYFRPLHSKKLNLTITNDYTDLPASWTTNLNTSQYLTSPTYNLEINKFKVQCGQSIEEWEAAGWINHEYDARGWFQWYYRFWLGRRCEDDERQVSRWRNCVGETGRWRRMLLKKYVSAGVREVVDDGAEEEKEVSPVMHQTCHHWAFMVTQEVLDEYWRTGK